VSTIARELAYLGRVCHDVCHRCAHAFRNACHHLTDHVGHRPPLTPLVAGAGAMAVLVPVLAVPGAEAAPIRVHARYFGMHDGSRLAYDHLTFGSLRIWDAGGTWRDIETSPGKYDWRHLDSLVTAARDHGVRVMLVLGMTPSFYADSPSLPPSDLARFTDYVRNVMKRYRDFHGRRGIESYQVWNEGNVGTFWTGSPHRLAELTRIVDRVRNRIDPGATVVAPSFAVRLPGQRRWISAYQKQRVRGHHVWRYYDVNALSIYPKASYGDRTGAPEDAYRLLRRVRSRMDNAGVPRHVPVWATEVNYGVKSSEQGAVPADPISPSRQAANVLRTYLLGAARGLARVYWYRYDWGRVVDGQTIGNTLLTDPDDWSRVTPAGRAIRTAERWLTGRLVVEPGHRRPCARGHRGTYTCTVRHGPHVRTILWNPHHRVQVQVRGAMRRVDEHGRVTPMSGRTTTVRVGYRPVMFERRR
jgi:hypothetical protein